ncbi:MAG: diguanylate cyclase [Acidimicrobiales bacterium]
MDRLTGAADTGELMAQEAHLESQARDTEGHYGLILVDLVGLRKFNSDFDWATGDEVLIELAHRLQNLRPHACVARVEADKFAVLIDGLEQDEISTEGHQVRNELMSAPWDIGGKRIPVKVRINAVSGPLPHFTSLLWAAQRMSRERSRWQLKQKIEEFENLARLNAIQAELGSFQFELANSISQRDPLTGALNLRGFRERQAKLETPYALAFVDLDNLRMHNESQGENWEAGNQALIGVKRLLESVSSEGVVARWGGDEFALCLPGFTGPSACEALNVLLEHSEFRLRIGDRSVTFSGGVTTVVDRNDEPSAMKRAQQCAKDAKAAGRRRVLLAD